MAGDACTGTLSHVLRTGGRGQRSKVRGQGGVPVPYLLGGGPRGTWQNLAQAPSLWREHRHRAAVAMVTATSLLARGAAPSP